MVKDKELNINKYPTLGDYLLVKNILIKHQDIPLRLKEIKKLLRNKINYNKIKSILSYLDYQNKVVHGSKGFLWIENNNKKLKRMIERGLKV